MRRYHQICIGRSARTTLDIDGEYASVILYGASVRLTRREVARVVRAARSGGYYVFRNWFGRDPEDFDDIASMEADHAAS